MMAITNISQFPAFGNFPGTFVHFGIEKTCSAFTFVQKLAKSMLRIILLDDTNCKKEIGAFVKKHKASIRAMMKCGADDFTGSSFNTSLGNTAGKKVLINTNESITLLNICEIVRCESDRNYTTIIMVNGKKYVVSKTLLEFDKMLSRYKFLRIHKSHLINIDHIERYVKAEGGQIVLSDGVKIPVASRKKEYLFREFEKL